MHAYMHECSCVRASMLTCNTCLYLCVSVRTCSCMHTIKLRYCYIYIAFVLVLIGVVVVVVVGTAVVDIAMVGSCGVVLVVQFKISLLLLLLLLLLLFLLLIFLFGSNCSALVQLLNLQYRQYNSQLLIDSSTNTLLMKQDNSAKLHNIVLHGVLYQQCGYVSPKCHVDWLFTY